MSKNKQINKMLDDAWSLTVKEVANFRCEVCGKRSPLNSHHIIGRRNFALRWELKNGVCLCVSCHKFGNQSAHSNPLWFDKWLRENRKEDYEFLQNPVNSGIKKWTLEEKDKQYQYLKTIKEII